MIIDFLKAPFYYVKAVKFIFSNRLFKYILIPGLISVFLCGFMIGGIFKLQFWIGDKAAAVYPVDWIGSNAIDEVAGFVGFFLALIILVFSLKYLVIFIVSPFMGSLSERTEKILLGKPDLQTYQRTIWEGYARSFRLMGRNMTRETLLVLILLPFSLIPIIGLWVTVIILSIQAYYAGFGNIDAWMDRHFDYKGAIQNIKTYKGHALGNGALFLLLFTIPVLGWFLAPALGTVAGTMLGVEKMQASLQSTT